MFDYIWLILCFILLRVSLHERLISYIIQPYKTTEKNIFDYYEMFPEPYGGGSTEQLSNLYSKSRFLINFLQEIGINTPNSILQFCQNYERFHNFKDIGKVNGECRTVATELEEFFGKYDLNETFELRGEYAWQNVYNKACILNSFSKDQKLFIVPLQILVFIKLYKEDPKKISSKLYINISDLIDNFYDEFLKNIPKENTIKFCFKTLTGKKYDVEIPYLIKKITNVPYLCSPLVDHAFKNNLINTGEASREQIRSSSLRDLRFIHDRQQSFSSNNYSVKEIPNISTINKEIHIIMRIR